MQILKGRQKIFIVGYLLQLHFYKYYRSLMKERPWVEHLTSLPKRGVGTLPSVSCISVFSMRIISSDARYCASQTPQVHSETLAPKWAFVWVNFDPIQEVGPKVRSGCSFKMGTVLWDYSIFMELAACIFILQFMCAYEILWAFRVLNRDVWYTSSSSLSISFSPVIHESSNRAGKGSEPYPGQWPGRTFVWPHCTGGDAPPYCAWCSV